MKLDSYLTASLLHAKVASTVIHRINFPRNLGSPGKVGKDGITRAISRQASLGAKSRPLLSPQEEMDVRQETAFVLVATGALERDTMTFSDWKEVFRAVRGRNCLRIDRRSKNRSEIVSIDTMTEEALDVIGARIGSGIGDALKAASRATIARKIRYEHSCLIAAFNASTSRKRKSAYHGALRFLRWLSSYAISRNGNSLSDLVTLTGTNDASASRRMAAMRYCDFRDIGEVILTNEAISDIAPRVYKSFEDICTGSGILA